MINVDSLKSVSEKWTKNKLFPHFVVDNFFDLKVAQALENEFPNFPLEVHIHNHRFVYKGSLAEGRKKN